MTGEISPSNNRGSGILYFGYGAMVNSVSRARRGIETLNERPAVLEDYRLTFAYGGAGNIMRKRGYTVHGVLMECKTEEDWQKLKDFDAGYDNIMVDVYPYDTEDPVQAHIFVMEHDESENARLPDDKLPQERYIRVIAMGMKNHGVDEEYVDYTILNVPYIPNRKPDDYLTFPQRTGGKGKLKTISYNEYVKKSTKKVWFLIGSKVIQLGDHDPNSAFVEWMMARVVGKPDCTWVLLQTLYDPDLPECSSESDIQPLHIAWTENQMMEKFEQAELTAEVFALLKDEPPSNGPTGVKRLSRSIKNFSRSMR